jgi:N-acetylglutamate synthase-like GNAT family acetyltransferase
MPSPPQRVRRATLDDLPGLRELWTLMRIPPDELERRLTEFQVVESGDGHVVGGIGIQIQRHHAWLHSEAYRDFSGADELRALLLQRIHSLASNHGVLRLWTRETAPFWTHHGFQPADSNALKKLPEAWTGGGSGWLTLQLKDEEAIVSLDKELALFKESERERSAKALRQAQLLKRMATFMAIVFALFVMAALFYLLRKDPGIFTLQR